MSLAMPARRRMITLLLAGTLPVAALTACTGPDADDTAKAAGKAPSSITTAWPVDIGSIDPANLSTGTDRSLVRNIYQTLVSPAFTVQDDGSLKFEGAEVKPMLAESWTVEGNSITYKLRQGVKFYGSENPLTAQDVKWSLGRIWNTPGVGDLQANGLQSPDDIKVVDDSTVKIDFKLKDGTPTPITPTLLATFSQPYTSIVDYQQVKPHITSADPDGATWLRSNAAGTGPYYIAAREVGTAVHLKAVPDSWLPQPSFTTVDIRITSGSVPSLLQNGDINFGESGMTNAQVNTLEKAGLSVFWQNTGHFDLLAITSGPAKEVGALADKSVRQAIAYALPYDQILKNVVYNRGSRDLSMVAPSAPEYTPAWSKYTTDLTKAKALMAEAGNPKLTLPLHYSQGSVDQTNTAILVQGSLKEIGITAVLTPQTEAGMFTVVDSRSTPATDANIGPPGLLLFNWTAWTDDPKIVIGYWATTGGINNYSLWSSPAVDKINTKYALQATSSSRTAAYKQAQEIIAEDVPVIPIVATGAVTVVAKGITGVSFTPTGSGRFWTLHPTGSTSEINATFS
jgi:peptide/nickel transport system substrate-binding protein